MSFEQKLDQVLTRHQELAVLMSDGSLSGEDFTKLSMEYAELSPVAEAIEEFKSAKKGFSDAEEMINDPDMDKEMKTLAEEEAREFKGRIPALERNIQLSLIPKDAADSKDAILEIRAGTGGDEAALFAMDLFEMYKGYASQHGWKFEFIDGSESDAGGYKQVTATIAGKNVFSRLKFESGVHRVQRVPKTESSGRIHTSAATVAVLPEAEDVDVEINPADLRVDTFRAQGSGGQHVNTTDSAVRVTHIPTGVVAECQSGRSQHKNKDMAMQMLRSRIYEVQRQKLAEERAADRKSQVGSGDRSERIRTYNFPQGRVSDHRINLTLHKLEKVLMGEALDELIDQLTAEDQADKLADLSW